jgi:hypothetical protein
MLPGRAIPHATALVVTPAWPQQCGKKLLSETHINTQSAAVIDRSGQVAETFSTLQPHRKQKNPKELKKISPFIFSHLPSQNFLFKPQTNLLFMKDFQEPSVFLL